MTRTQDASVADPQHTIAVLRQERDAALAREAALAEVLDIINRSPDDPRPVFDAILQMAHALCDASVGALVVYDGTHFRGVATRGYPAELADAMSQGNCSRPGSPPHRLIDGERLVHNPDLREHDGWRENPIMRGLIEDGHVRTSLLVPLRKDGTLLGYISANRQEVRPFSPAEISLLESFAAQAVIAIENARLLTEQQEALERQTATAEVLQVINASPGNLAPVFDAMLEKAMRLCGAAFGLLRSYDGKHVRTIATRGIPETLAEWTAQTVITPRATTMKRVLDSGRSEQNLDLRQEEGYENGTNPGVRAVADLGGARTILFVPLVKDGRAVGFFTVYRQEVRAFSDRQISLLESFAAQAVIAMDNARLLTEQQEALERQTATAEVLKAISRSAFDLDTVLNTLIETAMRLCAAKHGGIFRKDGNVYRYAAGGTDVDPAYLDHEKRTEIRAGRGTLVGRVALTNAAVQIPDAWSDPEYAEQKEVRLAGMRAMLGVPLLRDGEPIGAFALARTQPLPFTERLVELVTTLADQAVIAIENARLLGELQSRTAELATRNTAFSEQIEHQSAAIDVLKAMSASPGDAQPVLDLIVRRAQELCGSIFGGLVEYDGELVHLRSVYGDIPGNADAYVREFPMVPTRGSAALRAILDAESVHVRDADVEPGLSPAALGVGGKATLSVPMLRDGKVIGAITINAKEPGGFSDSQVELLKTFAEQAVIAIRSAQTFSELEARTAALAQRNSEFGERIDQQAATIDVLKVMSASPDDTQPIFDQICRRAQDLCNCNAASIWEYDGRLLHNRSLSVHPAASAENIAASNAYIARFPMEPSGDTGVGRVILQRQLINLRITEEERLHASIYALGISSTVGLPLLRDGQPVGAFMLNTADPGGFSDSQVELLKTFAEQAVIAITSVATYRQLRERTAELTRSVAELQALEEVLRAVNSSLDLETVLATIIDRAVPLAQADEGMIYEFDTAEQVFVPKAAFGMTEDRIARLRERRIRIGETFLGRSAQERVPMAVDDLQHDTSTQGVAEVLAGIHAVLAVPLLREDAVVGGLVIRRRSEGAFAPATVALMQTFAAQSVLAIENARLFDAARRARAASDAALADLRRAQDRLVQTEKMASLGQVTAGIAHEIKNPLNFVNNFSELSTELINELKEALAPAPMDTKLRTEIDDLTTLLKGNLEKVVQHGKRADGIVRNMLLHSRESGGELRSVDLNATVEDALNLAYHGARAEKPGFNITLVRNFDPAAASLDLYPQEFTRVMLNLISNGFYAATRKKNDSGDPGFEPTLTVTTEARLGEVSISVRDNGIGVPDLVKPRLFEPFFTTKPAGEGTGLGLSLSHDIIVKQHNGSISVDSRVGEFTEFTVTLPRTNAGAPP